MKKAMNEKLSISESNPIKARFYDYEHFTYPWHFHDEYEIIYVEEGSGLRFVGDHIGEYRNGEIIFLGSNLPHYMRSDDIYLKGEKGIRVKGVIIQFEKEFMSHSINYYPQMVLIKELLTESQRGIHFPLPFSKKLTEYIRQLPDTNGVNQITTLLSLLQEMATCKKKQFLASPHFYETLSMVGNSRIEKILSYLNSSYTKEIHLKEIASMAAMNPTAFCRYFKEKTGKTFMQYILDMRIGYACKLLTLKDIHIAQVSMDCGFESITHFNRVFKRSTGFTPSQYREQVLK